MTRKELELAKQNLNARIREAIGYHEPAWAKYFTDHNRLEELKVFENEANELSTREIINSCLCYGDDYFKPFRRWLYKEQGYGIKSYAEEAAEKIVGGMTRVEELFAEQKADFEKATVRQNVYTDGEGLSYNSIVWADEELG